MTASNYLIVVKNMDGGTGKLVRSLRLIFAGSEYTFMCLDRPRYTNAHDNKGIHFFPDRERNREHYGLNPSEALCFFMDLYHLLRIVRRKKIGTIMAIDVHCALLAIAAKAFTPQLRVIVNSRNHLSLSLKNKLSPVVHWIVKRGIVFLFRLADEHIAVSQGVGSDLEKSFFVDKPIKVIPNAVVCKNTTRQKRVVGSCTVVSIGRLVEQKDHQTLVYAMTRVVSRFPHVRLIIVGDGPLKQRLNILIQKLNLSQHISIVGWKNNPETVLKEATVFVLSSKWEGFPNVILEAMCYGVPVISTDCPSGPRELLDRGAYGILVNPQNPGQMGDAIIRLLSDVKEYERYAGQSLKRVLYYTFSKMASSYRQVFFKLTD